MDIATLQTILKLIEDHAKRHSVSANKTYAWRPLAMLHREVMTLLENEISAMDLHLDKLQAESKPNTLRRVK